MRRKDETLRETLLDFAREIAAESGPQAISIRELASRARVATGTVYNYFADKGEILLALTEEYWREALADMRAEVYGENFLGQFAQIFTFLRARLEGPGGELMAGLHKAAGQERMRHMQAALGGEILLRMRADTAIRQDIWTEDFTQEDFADFLLRNLILALRAQDSDIQLLLEILQRLLY